jgi:hypothetical protein
VDQASETGQLADTNYYYDVEKSITDHDSEVVWQAREPVCDILNVASSSALPVQGTSTEPAETVQPSNAETLTSTAYDIERTDRECELSGYASEVVAVPELCDEAATRAEKQGSPTDEQYAAIAAAALSEYKVCLPCAPGTSLEKESRSGLEAEQNFLRAHLLTNSHEVQAAFILHKKHPLNDSASLRLFELLDVASAGIVTIAEIQQATGRNSSGEAHDIIHKYHDTPLAHLRNRKAVKIIFDHIDTHRTGGISLAQWKAFLAELMLHDHDYLRRKGLSHHRAYFGKGYTVATPVTASSEEGSTAGVEGIATEANVASATKATLAETAVDMVLPCLYALCGRDWLQDFVYYQRNHHPLLGLRYADSDNPLTKVNRLQIEFVVNSYNLFASTVVYTMSGSTVGLYCLSIAVVSLPMVVMRNLLLQLFTCPCLQLRNRHPRCCQRCCVNCLRTCGYGIGTAYALGGAAFLVFGVLSCLNFGSGFVLSWLFAWGLSYFICIAADLCLPFNCLSPCIWIVRNKYGCLLYRTLKYMDLGRWQLEKDEVLKALAGREQQCRSTAGRKEVNALEGQSQDELKGSWKGSSRREYFSWGFWSDSSSRSHRYGGYKETQVLPV